MSDSFLSSEDEGPLSPEVPFCGDTQVTPTTGSGGQENRRQLFNTNRVLGTLSNSNNSRTGDDTQQLILEEVRKTNESLAHFSSRLDAIENRVKNIEQYQLHTASSSVDSSVEKVKRKVPVRVRVSDFT